MTEINKANYSLVQAEDDFMVEQEGVRNIGDQRPGLWPSEASVSFMRDGFKIVKGKCMRAAWYRSMGDRKAGVASAGLIWKGHLGKRVEESQINKWKEMGLYVASNIKFYDRRLVVSGEVDAIIKNPIDNSRVGYECFTPDSLLLEGDYRLNPIKEIVDNSTKTVISHTGYKNKIKNIQVKEVKDINVYRFRGKFDGLPWRATGEHPILVAKMKVSEKENSQAKLYEVIDTSFKKAKEIERGDYLCLPKATFGKEKDERYKDYHFLTQDSTWKHRIIEDRIYSTSKNALVQENGLPTKIVDLESFYWLLGLYLAEGSCTKGQVYFSLHEKELEIIEKIRNIAKSLFNSNICVRPLKNYKTGEWTKGINVTIGSRALVNLIKCIIPGNSLKRTKHIKYNLIDHRYIKEILKGVFLGDGCKIAKDQCRITTCVPHLAYLYFQLGAYEGLSPNIKKHQQMSNFNSEYIYAVAWSNNVTKKNQEKLIDGGTFWAYKVKKIETEKYSGPVYNLECTPDHTYTMGCVVTHNCKSFYNYPANQSICGAKSKNRAGAPKDQHFLQSAIYSYKFTVEQKKLDQFRTMYIERGDGHRVEFEIGFEEEPNKVFRPYWRQIPGPHWNIFKEEKVLQPYTIGDVHERYIQLIKHLKTKTMPARDYKEELTGADMDLVQNMFENGEIGNKTKYEKYMKNPNKNPLERWECSYCSFQDECRKDSM